jgi:hypothetical protein
MGGWGGWGKGTNISPSNVNATQKTNIIIKQLNMFKVIRREQFTIIMKGYNNRKP